MTGPGRGLHQGVLEGAQKGAQKGALQTQCKRAREGVKPTDTKIFRELSKTELPPSLPKIFREKLRADSNIFFLFDSYEHDLS